MMSRISRDLAAHHSHGRPFLRSLSGSPSVGSKGAHVAIIGAGFSGLRCADVLLQNGAHVTMFEARNRLGGRVLQYATEKYSFDMGPNWIHGTEGNPMMTLAQETGTIVVKPEEKQFVFDSAGRMKSEKESLELGADTWAIIVDAFKYSNDHCSEIDPQTSLMDFFKAELSKKFPHDGEQVRDRVNEARMWGPFVGDPIDRQSLRNFFLEECLEGENVLVASTYSKILTEVAKKAQQDAELRLGEEVVKIEYRSANDPNSKIAVTTAQGERSLFDEVVVTCPLGWLKRHKDAFSPDLPPRLTQAIDNIGYGHLEKIYVTFPSAWWMNSVSGEKGDGVPKSSIGNNPSKQIDPLFVHFHHPTYHSDPASKKNEFWNQSVVNLAHLPGSTAQPTLLFYMYGPCSIYVTSMIGPYELGSETYRSLLYDFVQPFFSRLPCYSITNPVCDPVNIVATQWSNDPYAGHGSYSNFQVGLVQGDDDIKCLRDTGGLSDEGRGLWLAGEHTAPFVAIGTTTGAYWSGEAVARKLLHRYGVSSVKTGDKELNGTIGEGMKKELNGEVKDGANLSALAI